GLIRQIDDELGRLFEYMDRRGLFSNTLVVFTSDHGDFLGDHWLGEKELFHDTVQRVPFIVCDPDPAAEATRGMRCDAFVEGVDLVPTVLDVLGLDIPAHRIEGASILPWLRDPAIASRKDAVFSELDYSFKAARRRLGREV